MSQTTINSLWITLIGMGIVFLALLLLWGLMTLMVKVGAPRTEAEEASEIAEEKGEPQVAGAAIPVPDLGGESRLKAAAAAVAVALALRARKNGHPSARPTGQSFSAWQSVLRANQLTQHSRMYTRKQRGTEQ
ncbi:MAG TPA: OadG family transporter subunit [Anaerolineaceae bacterium]|nr:OadG family transporter subunit [Anaerolineaceae bacterium]